MENHRFRWVNQLFLWPFSIIFNSEMLVYQRVPKTVAFEVLVVHWMICGSLLDLEDFHIWMNVRTAIMKHPQISQSDSRFKIQDPEKPFWIQPPSWIQWRWIQDWRSANKSWIQGGWIQEDLSETWILNRVVSHQKLQFLANARPFC